MSTEVSLRAIRGDLLSRLDEIAAQLATIEQERHSETRNPIAP